MHKRCANCKQMLELIEFNLDRQKKDGHCSWCRECKSRTKYGETKQRHGPRMNKSSNVITYRVVYDPCDSFSVASEFSRPEIYDMLREEYLAIGTTFFRNRDDSFHRVTVSEFTGDLKFEMVLG